MSHYRLVLVVFVGTVRVLVLLVNPRRALQLQAEKFVLSAILRWFYVSLLGGSSMDAVGTHIVKAPVQDDSLGVD